MIKNTKYEVLTPQGFKAFEGIQQTERMTYTLSLSNGYSVECTDNHQLYEKDMGWVELRQLCEGDEVSTDCGFHSIVSINQNKINDVYDLIGVDTTESYYTNGVLSHNCSLIYIDECAFIPRDMEFYESTYPVIASGKNSRVIITSTPNGQRGLFYKLWTESEAGKNEFKRVKVIWSDVPGRDEHWKDQTVRNTSYQQFLQEHECVGPETLVTIKIDNVVQSITIKELRCLDNYQPKQIATPHGWCKFDGVSKIIKPQHCIIKTKRKVLRSSLDHLIMTRDGWIEAQFITQGMLIKSKNRFLKVVSKTIVDEPLDLYDVTNVRNVDHSYYTNNIVSHNCNFRGSQNSLINGEDLEKQITQPIIDTIHGVNIYEHPIKDTHPHQYLMTVDVSRGLGGDYSTFSVFDITSKPYKQVATYRNNRISPILFPSVIHSTANYYNKALVLIEINDIGEQTASIMFNEFEYENLLTTVRDKNSYTIGFAADALYGVRTTTKVKSIGVSTLETMIHNNLIEISDGETITELSTFVPKRGSYEADAGCHDDMVMTLVLFAWLTTQQYFIELTNRDVRQSIIETFSDRAMEELMPFGIIDDEFGGFDGSMKSDWWD